MASTIASVQMNGNVGVSMDLKLHKAMANVGFDLIVTLGGKRKHMPSTTYFSARYITAQEALDAVRRAAVGVWTNCSIAVVTGDIRVDNLRDA